MFACAVRSTIIAGPAAPVKHACGVHCLFDLCAMAHSHLHHWSPTSVLIVLILCQSVEWWTFSQSVASSTLRQHEKNFWNCCSDTSYSSRLAGLSGRPSLVAIWVVEWLGAGNKAQGLFISKTISSKHSHQWHVDHTRFTFPCYAVVLP